MTESNRPATGPHKDGGWSSTLIRLVFLVLLIASVNIGVKGLVDTLELQFYPSHLKLLEWAVVIGVAAYVFLMATPFVPGIEIGLALMMLLGWQGVVLVYLCTLLALSISFLVGGYIPAEWLGALLRWVIVDGKLYLNFSEDARDRFQHDPLGNIDSSEKNWAKLQPQN